MYKFKFILSILISSCFSFFEITHFNGYVSIIVIFIIIIIIINLFQFGLRILTGKKHPKIKLQRLQKIRICTFGSLVHQINSFQEVLKLKQISQKNKAVTG